MKKLVLLLALFISIDNVYAADCNYKCVEKYDMSNKISTFFSNITGLNFSRTKISEAVLKKTISKSVQGKNLKVNIGSYSGKDLANGIFKSMTISGTDLNIDGIYLSSFELKTLCEFNYIQYDKHGNLSFKEDFPMSFKMEISADDINKSMQSEKYKNALNKVNTLSFAGVKVSSTESSIRGNKFYYSMNISLPFMKPQKIEMAADLKVDNGEIDFVNTRLTSNSKSFDLKSINFLMNYINPLDFSINIFDNKDAKIYVKNVAIKNNIIIADGIIIVPKD